MPFGINMFSFDLFGLAHRAERREQDTVPAPRKDDIDRAEDDQDSLTRTEHYISFWGMYPVL